MASLYAVLGDPVSHSRSPAMHNAAFRAEGRDARYEARAVAASECGTALRELALGGGGGNVTVPHKERVLPFLDCRTRAVAATGACNTFWAADGAVWGDNTDVAGFAAAWRKAAAGLSGPTEVLVLGAGGAARAVLFALLADARVRRAAVWNRTRERANALLRHFGSPRAALAEDWRRSEAAAVVNATSAGMNGSEAPVDLERMAARPRVVVDLVYGAEPTALVRQARSLGIAAADGREMLVRQAEASYARWFGAAPPEGVMRCALG